MSKRAILYSFRRCPYAIRARLAIRISGLPVALREVKLANKPEALLACSSKGTVPVLQLPTGSVIDESLDIMRWGLEQSDPEGWLHGQGEQLIEVNDDEFKRHLDHYKYADRFPEQSMAYYRQQAEGFIGMLEQQLHATPFLSGEHCGLADMAIFPFIRQFAFVDKGWFDQSEYTQLQAWLQGLLSRPLFLSVMDKYVPWQPDDETIIF